MQVLWEIILIQFSLHLTQGRTSEIFDLFEKIVELRLVWSSKNLEKKPHARHALHNTCFARHQASFPIVCKNN